MAKILASDAQLLCVSFQELWPWLMKWVHFVWFNLVESHSYKIKCWNGWIVANVTCGLVAEISAHDDVIKWKHFPRYWPFIRGIHWSPVNSPHKGQWRGALMFSLICIWINGWVNNREAGDLRRYRAHYDIIVMHILAQVKKSILLCILCICYPLKTGLLSRATL